MSKALLKTLRSNKNYRQQIPISLISIITTPRTWCIYFLPKIHKPNDPGRPIVSACSCPTELISNYLDNIWLLLSDLYRHTFKTVNAHFKFFATSISRAKTNLFSLWILYLYTVIPNGEGLLALKHFFDLRTVKETSSETLLRQAEVVLTLNCFSFADYQNGTRLR